MISNIIIAVRLTIFSFIVFCGVYPVLIWAIAQFSPNQGKGFIVAHSGKAYYVNIAQAFKGDKFFWCRPSAVDYNAGAAGGTNHGPSNPDHLLTVQNRINHFLAHNPGIKKSEIPSELVTASGSGLDPHISIQAAQIQVKRISKARGISEQSLSNLIEQCTEKPLLGLLGTKKINVLKINLALENL